MIVDLCRVKPDSWDVLQQTLETLQAGVSRYRRLMGAWMCKYYRIVSKREWLQEEPFLKLDAKQQNSSDLQDRCMQDVQFLRRNPWC